MARLAKSQVVRLGGLLDMMYKPGEIAERIGVAVDTIYRSHIPAGAPMVRDERDPKRIWIPGLAYRDWARDQLLQRQAAKRKLSPNEAYCVRCHKSVEMVDAHRKSQNEKIGMISGRCPVCRGKVNRFFKIGGEE